MKTITFKKKISFAGRYQTGLTLLEIIIAMAIGLFLLAGLIQIFISTKQSYNVQDAVARIEENSRFALDTLSKNIRLAGYRTDPWQDVASAFPVSTLFPLVRQIISGVDGGTQSDQINIRFRGSVDTAGVADGRILDCAGASVGDTSIELSFSLNGSDLTCTINGALPAEIIADNIVNMQVVYGEDSSGNGTVNKYIDASSISNWNNIISVKIGLVVSSDLNTNENLANEALFFPNLSDNPINAVFDIDADGNPDLFESAVGSGFDTQTAPDKRLYKVYTTTIALRNRVL